MRCTTNSHPWRILYCMILGSGPTLKENMITWLALANSHFPFSPAPMCRCLLLRPKCVPKWTALMDSLCLHSKVKFLARLNTFLLDENFQLFILAKYVYHHLPKRKIISSGLRGNIRVNVLFFKGKKKRDKYSLHFLTYWKTNLFPSFFFSLQWLYFEGKIVS